MKLLIAGSRTLSPSPIEIDAALIMAAIDINDITEVVSGTAPGVDQCGERWARIRMKNIKRFPANWSHLGKIAGKFRNKEMADYLDAALIFWDGMSSGTADMIARIISRKKMIYIIAGKTA